MEGKNEIIMCFLGHVHSIMPVHSQEPSQLNILSKLFQLLYRPPPVFCYNLQSTILELYLACLYYMILSQKLLIIPVVSSGLIKG